MAQEDLEGEIIEVYDIPLVGEVKILQDKTTKEYFGWISGIGMVN